MGVEVSPELMEVKFFKSVCCYHILLLTNFYLSDE